MPTAILDEIAADQDPRLACRACAWIREQPRDEQAQWNEATLKAADKVFTKTSLMRAIRRRSNETVKTVEAHVDSRHQVAIK